MNQRNNEKSKRMEAQRWAVFLLSIEMAEDRRNSGMTDQWEVYINLGCTSSIFSMCSSLSLLFAYILD